MLKLKHLNKSVRVVIAAISKLINKTKKSPINLATILYNLSEKNLEKIKLITATLANVLDAKEQAFEISIVANSIVDDFVSKNFFQKNISKINIYSKNLIELIRQTYHDNEILQRIMKIKKTNLRRISTNLTKKNVKLKLENCEISDELF